MTKVSIYVDKKRLVVKRKLEDGKLTGLQVDYHPLKVTHIHLSSGEHFMFYKVDETWRFLHVNSSPVRSKERVEFQTEAWPIKVEFE